MTASSPATRRPLLALGAARFGVSLYRAQRVFRRSTTRAADGSHIATWIGGPDAGRPVVFLHGFCSDQSSMRPMALAVAKRRPVVLYDARGHGKSVLFSDQPTMRALADDLDAVLQQHAPDGADAVGLSMGAQTLFEFLRSHSGARLHRLAFIDQSPRVLSGPDWPHGLFGQIDAAELDEVRLNLKHNPRSLGAAWLRGLWRSDEHLAMKLLLSPSMATGLRNVPASTLRLAEDMLQQDWRDEVRAIQQPTLLLYGGRSIYPGAGGWMAQTLPHARYEYFPTSGHALVLEEPRRTAAAVANFFR
jgi:non-heme chloroperoxidase